MLYLKSVLVIALIIYLRSFIACSHAFPTIFVYLCMVSNFYMLLSVIQVFATPKDHRKSKPYHDHVFVFSIADDHIWFRNYQVCDVVLAKYVGGAILSY